MGQGFTVTASRLAAGSEDITACIRKARFAKLGFSV